MAKISKSNVPSELEGAAKIGDVNALEERVDKCFSHEKYNSNEYL